MTKYIIGAVALGLLAVATPALAARHEYRDRCYRSYQCNNYSQPVPAPAPTSTPPAQGGEVRVMAYVTLYSVYDNDPAGSLVTWLDGKEGSAGGKGTYSNPKSLAVAKGSYPYGTMFYDTKYKMYFKAVDTCASCGSVPRAEENKGAQVWIDEFLGGFEIPKSQANSLMNARTGIREIIVNPKSDYAVNLTQ